MTSVATLILSKAYEPSSFFLQTAEPRFSGPCGSKTDVLLNDPYTKDLQPEVRVQILNLMDMYDKRTVKTSGKYEYRLGWSEVTIVARASKEIKRVRVYVQRCPEAAARTNDTTGTLLNFTSTHVNADASLYSTGRKTPMYTVANSKPLKSTLLSKMKF